MNRDRRLPVLITGLLAAALILSAVAWNTQPPREPLILSAREGASPSTDPTEVAFRAKTLAHQATEDAWMAGTVTPVPTATFPPKPTPTEPTSCIGGLPEGMACAGATSTPTEVVPNIVPPPTPLPTWPGEAMQTPGARYQMGKSDDITDYPR